MRVPEWPLAVHWLDHGLPGVAFHSKGTYCLFLTKFIETLRRNDQGHLNRPLVMRKWMGFAGFR